MRLKARDSQPISSPLSGSGTRAARSPWRTWLAAAIRSWIGRESWLAKASPTQVAAMSRSSATTTKIAAKVIWKPSRCFSRAL